jgi:hypothetical protein
LGDLPIDFYVLPGSLDRARTQFAQAKPMLEAYQKYFGEYPFKKDGYKLIEAPYSGMEHQSAVTYGNRFANGYLERDWTGVGISTKFDFIIIHESGHEWFGNAISAADVSDMWIHEGWTTYLEGLYVEHVFGHDDAIKYLNGYKSKVRNREPIITTHAIHRSPPQDMYFKGALFLNTLRSIVNDDARWWKLLRDLFQHFKYQNIMTEDLVAFVNAQVGRNLTPVFDQYLRHADLPTLELRFNEADGTVSYRWKADEPAFAMPVRIGSPGAWQIIEPTTTWATMKTSMRRENVQVATDLYYINVAVTPAQNRQRKERRPRRRSKDRVRRLLIVRRLRVVDVDEGLRVPVEHREPRALNLHHHAMALEKRVVLVAEREGERRGLVGHHRLGRAHAGAELRAQDVAGEQHLEVAHADVVRIRLRIRRVARIHVDQLHHPVAVGAGRSRRSATRRSGRQSSGSPSAARFHRPAHPAGRQRSAGLRP